MQVAVFDPLPMFRLGIIAALGQGTQLDSPSELSDWVAESAHPALLVLTLASDPENDPTWQVLTASRQRAALHVVALLDTYNIQYASLALKFGAASVLPRPVDAHALRQSIHDVEHGELHVRLDVLRVAAGPPGGPDPRVRATDEEIGWLRGLRSGHTIQAVATLSGVSERMLYRRLHHLYRRLGVENRTQALILGRDQGWL